jgi:hypothetical protein
MSVDRDTKTLIGMTKIPVPTSRDKVLIVEGVPADWPCDQGACLFVARYALRVALENNAIAIDVRQGRWHRHRFDVVDILKDSAKFLGGWLPPPEDGMPSLTAQHAVSGAEFGEHKIMVSVPEIHS